MASVIRGDDNFDSGSLPAPTSAQVGAATAGLAAGAVGSYAFLTVINYGTYTDYNEGPGTLRAGSTLNWAGVGYPSYGGGGAPAGTWRLMGRSQYYRTSTLQYDNSCSVWLRIS